jgi:hypothetical protein
MFKVIKTAEQAAFEELKKSNEIRIAEIKQLLSDSDFKVMADYDKPNDAIKTQRQLWRDELRALESK